AVWNMQNTHRRKLACRHSGYVVSGRSVHDDDLNRRKRLTLYSTKRLPQQRRGPIPCDDHHANFDGVGGFDARFRLLGRPDEGVWCIVATESVEKLTVKNGRRPEQSPPLA